MGGPTYIQTIKLLNLESLCLKYYIKKTVACIHTLLTKPNNNSPVNGIHGSQTHTKGEMQGEYIHRTHKRVQFLI